MRIPGVNATPTQGGFQSFSTPEQGLAAISRQLDRYASGATTGRPLTTIRDIVSTWAPPSENPTETLIQRAERVMGVGRSVPLDLSNPATKAKLIEATIRIEQDDRLPVDPSLISKVAGASPDQYIPSGPASSLPITRAQYSGGLPGGGAAPLATPPGAGAALATPSGGGVIPGTGMTPQQLGALNALMKMGGLGDPLNSLLETYYKSPAYLGEAAGASKRGELGAEIELRPTLESAIAWAKIDPNINEAERKAQINRYSKQLEQIGAAQTTTVKDVPVLDQNGQTVLKNMLQSEITLNSADRAARAARGDTTPRPGDIVGTPFAIGNTPPGYEYRMTPQGALAAQPVPGTPAAQEAQDVLRKQKQSDLQLQVSRDIVMQNTDRIENLVRNSALPTTGAGGAWLSRLGGTAANDVRVMVETLKARSSLDALNQMRQSSSTGGALGNVSNAEGDRLAAALSNLDQSQSQEQFLFNLRRAKQAYVEAVHGPGAYSALSDAPVLKVPNAGAGAVARPEGSTDATLRSEAAAAIAGGRSRAAVIERLQKMGVSTEGL
jgi:hypothetical protein